jgi:hypothetical protein
MRKFFKKWRRFWLMVEAILSRLKTEDTPFKEETMDYSSFEENLFVHQNGANPAEVVSMKDQAYSVEIEDILTELGAEIIFRKWRIDKTGFWEVDEYYDMWNMEVHTILKITRSRSFPYHWLEQKLDTDSELKYWKIATKSLEGALVVSNKFDLVHYSNLVFVFGEVTPDWRNTERTISQYRLTPASLDYVNDVGEKLLAQEAESNS